MDPKEIDPRKWTGEIDSGKWARRFTAAPRRRYGQVSRTEAPVSNLFKAAPHGGRFGRSIGAIALTLVAAVLPLAACDAPPRELTEAERICAPGPSLECAQARQHEKLWQKEAKELQEAGVIR